MIVIRTLRLLLLVVWLLTPALPAAGGTLDNILPLDHVKPGMRGEVYTILEGDQIEKIELEVIGILPNLMGPKQDIILVKLLGDRAQQVGVVAGMSGSPVYIQGKLVGALSLRFGIFTSIPLGGVTPIQNMLEVDVPAAAMPPTKTAENFLAPSGPAFSSTGGASGMMNGAANGYPASGYAASSGAFAGDASGAATANATSPAHFPLPEGFARQAGLSSGAYLAPIETPLVFSGFQQAAVEQFAGQFAGYGMLAAQGGTSAPQADDAKLEPGQMVGLVLATGDLSISAGCSVTAVEEGRVFVCGHPLFGFGNVALPMARGRVLTTLVSSLASTKIMNSGGLIGTVTQDRLTAVMGRLGETPRTIPIDLEVVTPARSKSFHFQVAENPRLTPLLVALATFNGLVANTVYSEGTTFHLTGQIALQGHSPVELDNMFAPNDFGAPDGIFVALSVQSLFNRVFTNPYETAKVLGVHLRVESVPERRQGFIENAWSERFEAAPGEQLRIKVLVRPYRGTPFLKEIPIAIPVTARGTLRVVVSDADTLNRMSNSLALSPLAKLGGLEQLVRLLNRERRNNRLYVALLQPAPTLLVEDKELPNAPLSEIAVLDSARSPGGSALLRESLAGEWSVPMSQVITGQHSIQITVK
jgi:hypothetical protein